MGLNFAPVPTKFLLQVWRRLPGNYWMRMLTTCGCESVGSSWVQNSLRKRSSGRQLEGRGHPAGGQGECDGGDGEGVLRQEGQGATRWHIYILPKDPTPTPESKMSLDHCIIARKSWQSCTTDSDPQVPSYPKFTRNLSLLGPPFQVHSLHHLPLCRKD